MEESPAAIGPYRSLRFETAGTMRFTIGTEEMEDVVMLREALP